MKRSFTVDASKKIQSSRKVQAARSRNWIQAAKGEEMEDPRIEQLDDLQGKVEDDFGYVMQGIERLGRENMLDEALNLLNTLADTLNSAVGVIGDDFDKGTDITEEV